MDCGGDGVVTLPKPDPDAILTEQRTGITPYYGTTTTATDPYLRYNPGVIPVRVRPSYPARGGQCFVQQLYHSPTDTARQHCYSRDTGRWYLCRVTAADAVAAVARW